MSVLYFFCFCCYLNYFLWRTCITARTPCPRIIIICLLCPLLVIVHELLYHVPAHMHIYGLYCVRKTVSAQTRRQLRARTLQSRVSLIPNLSPSPSPSPSLSLSIYIYLYTFILFLTHIRTHLHTHRLSWSLMSKSPAIV